VELGRLLAASRAVETAQETAEDLAYLQGRGTSLGGMRPKCTLQDEHGRLAIGKFPSVSDGVNVTRAEVLALRLAALAGIRTAQARCITLERTPVALIERFDRTTNQQRIPYLSAASFLLAERHEERSYAELAEVMRQRCAQPTEDVRELWRRLVFNLLITNTDDHLHNLGFLYAGASQWQLAPAFDLNPMPGKLRESKTWLTEDTGPIDALDVLLNQSAHFELNRNQAEHIVSEVLGAVRQWRKVGSQPEVGLTATELAEFEEAFEHPQIQAAQALTVG
jgi:serine/threonine-protein kinase HipA